TRDRAAGPAGNLEVTIGAAVAAFLFFTATVIAILRHQKGRNRTQPQPAVELEVIERRSLARDGDGSAPSVHIYWDADPPAADGEDGPGGSEIISTINTFTFTCKLSMCSRPQKKIVSTTA
ncbi:hypothetical protein BaRGS_00024580, partial [Batillaria attramentaria]